METHPERGRASRTLNRNGRNPGAGQAFSRSSCLHRVRSSVVRPGRRPLSRSACRTQWRSVSAAHPIFSAIDVIAAHCEGWSWACSNTIRTARYRTSGENRLGLAMAPILLYLSEAAQDYAWVGEGGWEPVLLWVPKDRP
jgi:hypothetical protein